MNRIVLASLLGLGLAAQACTTTPEHELIKTNSSSSNTSDSTMPKEFGSRFSTKNIKAEREAFYAHKRNELALLSPTVEVNKAIHSNNVHLMVVPASRGGTLSIPGLTNLQLKTISCRMQNIEGMGDVLYGNNHAAYRQEILNYSRRFNALIAPYCK